MRDLLFGLLKLVTVPLAWASSVVLMIIMSFVDALIGVLELTIAFLKIISDHCSCFLGDQCHLLDASGPAEYYEEEVEEDNDGQ